MTAEMVTWLRGVHQRAEATARAATLGEWHLDGGGRLLAVGPEPAVPTKQGVRAAPRHREALADDDAFYRHEDSEFVAANGPAAVVARVEAEREILDHYDRWQLTRRVAPAGWSENGATGYRMAMDYVVTLLAWGWRHAPGYVEGWAP